MVVGDSRDSFALENKLNWLYLDINSYFSTVEQQVNPHLRDKPVAVVPLMTDSTCAIAASYDAKLKGIKTGTRIYEAKRLCPDLICVQANHSLYVEYHNRIFAEFDKYLKVDHIFSIDEAACRLTGKYQSPNEAISIANIIKEKIKENVGDYISCSIGIGPNRYLAKIASDMQKPDGLTIIHPNDLPEKLYQLELSDLPGIGLRTKKKILKHGITSVQALCSLDPKRLRSIWGSVWGEKIWYLIRGADLPLEETKNRSIGHSQVLGPDSKSVEVARNILITLTLKVATRLRAKNLLSNSIYLEIVLSSGKIIKDRAKLSLSSDNNTFLESALKIWDNLIRISKAKETKKISISLGGLQEESAQMSFDDLYNHHKKKHQLLSRMIDELNKKLGSNMVTIGLPPKKHKIKSVVAFGHIPGVKDK